MSDRRWVRLSLVHLRDRLAAAGCPLSTWTLHRLLKDNHYSLKSNVKAHEPGGDHKDRNRQFEYIAEQKAEHLQAAQPVISVDTKKKELVGNFKNPGRAWNRKPQKVNTHDFPSQAEARAAPYGIYDVQHNRGFLCIGQSADTPEFAVDLIVQWWQQEGQAHYPTATRLLILADSGGSNGSRPRLWKQQLQEQVADRLGLTVTVSHYPTGCSKYNPIEHKLFSFISINWAAKPLRSFQTLLNLIRNTTTQSGLRISAFLSPRTYQKGKRVSDADMQQLNIHRHKTCPNWNYTVKPRLVQTQVSAWQDREVIYS